MGEVKYPKFGKDTEYRDIHYWVEKQLGKPMVCSDCGVMGRKRYHWANLSGEYKQDLADWKRLCVPCHAKISQFGRPGQYDKTHCKRGHEFTPENTYTNPTRGHRNCRTCKRQLQIDWISKRKAQNG